MMLRAEKKGELRLKGQYLCLLDNVSLDGQAIELGDSNVRRFSYDELCERLRGTEDLAPGEVEADRLRRLAMFLWVVREVPLRMPPAGKHSAVSEGFQGLGSARLEAINHQYRHAGSENNVPFDRFLVALNLLKGKRGPAIPCHICFRPPALRTCSQIETIVRRNTWTRDDDPDGNERAALLGFRLSSADIAEFGEVSGQLEGCFAEPPGPGTGRNAHLDIACSYYQRANDRFAPFEFDFGLIEPLITYEFSLESLVIVGKRDGKNALARRVSAIVKDRHQEVYDFMCLINWLRSKVAHGVKTIRELCRVIAHCQSAPNELGLPLPLHKYRQLFLQGGDFDGLTLNLREIARRCIRFFLDEYQKGIPREQTVRNLCAG